MADPGMGKEAAPLPSQELLGWEMIPEVLRHLQPCLSPIHRGCRGWGRRKNIFCPTFAMKNHRLLVSRTERKAGETLGKTGGILQLQLGLDGEDPQVLDILSPWERASLQDQQRFKLQGVTLEALAEASFREGGFPKIQHF